MKKEQLFLYFFAGVFLILLFQFLHILSPFFTGIFGAILLSLVFWPLHKVSVHLIGREKTNVSAAVSTTVLFLSIVVPCSLIGWLVYEEIRNAYPLIERFANTLEAWRQGEHYSDNAMLNSIEMRLHAAVKLSGIDLERLVLETTTTITESLIKIGRALPKNAISLFANFIVMVTTLFFLFRDGTSFLKKFKDLIPMDEKHKDAIVHSLYITVTAVVRGVMVVAVVQGILAGIGFAIVRVPSPILLGFLTSIFAIVPFIGAGVVWVSVAICFFFIQNYFQAGFIFLWGFFVISLVDNFLRPILIGGGTRLPFLAVFLGLVGGIKVYGPMGLFVGPLIVALILAFVRIYREEYALRIKKDEQNPQNNP